jgi:hypothetical protein
MKVIRGSAAWGLQQGEGAIPFDFGSSAICVAVAKEQRFQSFEWGPNSSARSRDGEKEAECSGNPSVANYRDRLATEVTLPASSGQESDQHHAGRAMSSDLPAELLCVSAEPVVWISFLSDRLLGPSSDDYSETWPTDRLRPFNVADGTYGSC